MAFSGSKDGNVRYYLSSERQGRKKIIDPKGWDESEREYSKNKDFKGEFTKISNNLEFNKNGA